MSAAAFTLGDGCQIAWRFDGPVEAPVLLLSNSLGTAMAMWDPQMERLAQRFRVLRYDSRGHGASAAPAGGYSLDRLGRDVVELLDHLDLAQVDFCGLSLGGMVGQWLGYRHPDRVRRCVLANTSAHMGPPQQWDGRIETVRRTGMAAIAEASVNRWFTQGFPERNAKAVAPIRAALLATDPMGYAGCCAAIRDMDLRRLAILNTVPSLVIAGALDPATPASEGQALVDALPDARLHLLHAAHLSNVEQPQAFTQAVLPFLDGS